MNDSSQIGLDFDAAALTHEERLILSLIRPGRDNARQVDEVAEASGINDRRVQMIVKHLIQVHDYFIGTATTKPFGYYIMTDEKEKNAVCQSLTNRGLSTLYRVARLKKTSVEAVFNQGVLEVVK